jgi:hypothetical protein
MRAIGATLPLSIELPVTCIPEGWSCTGQMSSPIVLSPWQDYNYALQVVYGRGSSQPALDMRTAAGKAEGIWRDDTSLLLTYGVRRSA